WTEDDWNRIIGAYPYAMKPDVSAYNTVASVTNTLVAWIRGDWFGFTRVAAAPLLRSLEIAQDLPGAREDRRR
ncbi:MAG TPA: hypothetical protein VFJ49_09470, partial [Methyloceanibacter sp.]|nr:hypothetical protein [Methyloceanibacter sp.]